ncbi:hypothetical protein [Flindersiella endophytica]
MAWAASDRTAIAAEAELATRAMGGELEGGGAASDRVASGRASTQAVLAIHAVGMRATVWAAVRLWNASKALVMATVIAS